MITSVFKKSTPLNFSLVVILILVFFSIYQFQDLSWYGSTASVIKKTGTLALILASIFITNFISKKSQLTRDSGYNIFFYFLFLCFFPSLLDDLDLILSNLFVILGLSRLLALDSVKNSKEKIFDASFWFFIATLFHFWCILYIGLVFISIIFHVASDYRNWFLPLLAFLAVAIISLAIGLYFNVDVHAFINTSISTNYKINYFTNNYQNAALSIYATITLFFMVSIFASLSNKPLSLLPSYKKIIAAFFIAALIFVISYDKSNNLLVFTISPLAMIATNHIEYSEEKLQQEIVMVVFILCSVFTFFSQL